MKKKVVKGKAKKKVMKVEKKYEEDGHSSNDDNDAPEVVSNSAMKSNLETLQKELANLKQTLRQAEKTKRRNRQEIYIAQKKAKLSNLEGLEDDEAKTNDNSSGGNQMPLDESAKVDSKQIKPKRKVYSSFNVIVEPLTKSEDTRASAALDFKSRRLAKVPRESVKNAVISYTKKLEARK